MSSSENRLKYSKDGLRRRKLRELIHTGKYVVIGLAMIGLGYLTAKKIEYLLSSPQVSADITEYHPQPTIAPQKAIKEANTDWLVIAGMEKQEDSMHEMNFPDSENDLSGRTIATYTFGLRKGKEVENHILTKTTYQDQTGKNTIVRYYFDQYSEGEIESDMDEAGKPAGSFRLVNPENEEIRRKLGLNGENMTGQYVSFRMSGNTDGTVLALPMLTEYSPPLWCLIDIKGGTIVYPMISDEVVIIESAKSSAANH